MLPDITDVRTSISKFENELTNVVIPAITAPLLAPHINQSQTQEVNR